MLETVAPTAKPKTSRRYTFFFNEHKPKLHKL